MAWDYGRDPVFWGSTLHFGALLFTFVSQCRIVETVQTGEHTETNKQTNGHYQVHYILASLKLCDRLPPALAAEVLCWIFQLNFTISYFILLLLSKRALCWFTAVGTETIIFGNKCYKNLIWFEDCWVWASQILYIISDSASCHQIWPKNLAWTQLPLIK